MLEISLPKVLLHMQIVSNPSAIHASSLASRTSEFQMSNSSVQDENRLKAVHGCDLQAHEAAITCMRYTHNENWLMTSDGIGRVKYWKGRNELVKVITPH